MQGTSFCHEELVAVLVIGYRLTLLVMHPLGGTCSLCRHASDTDVSHLAALQHAGFILCA